MTRQNQLATIINSLSAEARADNLFISEAETLLYHCGSCIDGIAIGWHADWPDKDIMRRLAAFEQGYGCWLDEVGEAIEAAPIEDADRALWRIAFNGAVALLKVYHIERRGDPIMR